MFIHARAAFAASCRRELRATLVSRFLHAHLALAAAAGLLPLFTLEEAAAAAPLWVLPAVLYCLSLSALLLGLSAAHADAEEFTLLFAQPAPRGAWLLGKAMALTLVLATAAVLLVVPAALAGGTSPALAALAASAGGVTLALAAVGLGVGFWIRDPVRGLLTGLFLWFVLLFGTDLALLAVSGAPWLHGHPSWWVVPLMANPLDALRVTLLFTAGQAAFASGDAGGLASWWLAHGWTWLALLLTAWIAGGLAAAVAGASRRLDA